MRLRHVLLALVLAAAADLSSAQPPLTTRVAILTAEDRRAPTARDVAVIRTGARNRDPQTVEIAIRALGRLERPSLIPDIVPALRASLPEIRAEAANAIGQAAQGWKLAPPVAPGHRTATASPGVGASSVDAVTSILTARLTIEAEPSVRAVLCETLGRLPYTEPGQVQRVEAVLLETLDGDGSVIGRLGVAKGLEALVRLNRKTSEPGAETLARLRELAVPPTPDRAAPGSSARLQADPASGARVRRLALEALIAAEAVTPVVIARAAVDADAQVRRLAMRAIAAGGADTADMVAVKRGLADDSALVRIEALRAARTGPAGDACAASVAAVGDRDVHVALVGIDQLAACVSSSEAGAVLERSVNDLSQAGSPRGWHRSAHALVALAAVLPRRARAALPQFAGSSIWQLRMYAARAAAALDDRATLEGLARDDRDNVREAAVAGLSKVAGHGADAVYCGALGRSDYQLLRTAANALAGTPDPQPAIRALRAALQRLVAEGRDNSRDAQLAIVETLRALGASADGPKPVRELRIGSQLNAEDLHRLQSARARITMRGGGAFDLALFSSEAPVSVVRFARLAEAGYYNGLTFHRVVPNFVVQGGSPAANELVGDAAFMRDEVGLWPHVRGAVGISTRGRDTGDAQIFIDLVDNPRLDHEHTVFAQVLNGIEVVDAILEGDVIETVAIVVGP